MTVGTAPALALLVAVAPVLSTAGANEAGAASIIVVADRSELAARFCTADVTAEHIVVLPAAAFVDSDELICPSGAYRLYRIVEHNDPDDFEYYLDPPFGTTKRLGCDGKAGRTMTTIAINCRPE